MTVPVWSISLTLYDLQISIRRGTITVVSNTTLNLDTPITLDPAGTYWLIVIQN